MQPPHLQGAKALSPRELAEKVLLHSLRRPDDWPRWFAAAGAPGLKLNQKLVFENSSLTYQGAINELGIAIAQIALVRDDLISGQLVMPTGFTLKRDAGYFLSYPSERARIGKIRMLHVWLGDEVRMLKRHVSALKPDASA